MKNNPQDSFGNMIHRNLLSLISLSIAITALFYNTWRNELSENNRNIRAAGFEIIREAAHLQLLVDQALYSNADKPDFIEGWARVNLIVSLSNVMPVDVRVSADQLKSHWQQNWEQAYVQEQANLRITKSVRALDISVRDSLNNLN